MQTAELEGANLGMGPDYHARPTKPDLRSSSEASSAKDVLEDGPKGLRCSSPYVAMTCGIASPRHAGCHSLPLSGGRSPIRQTERSLLNELYQVINWGEE